MPSRTAVRRCWQAVRQLASRPVAGKCQSPVLIGQVNQLLRGWGQYFQFGYPRSGVWAGGNAYVVARLTHHLQRRSQRPCHPPAGMSCASTIITRTCGMLRLL